MSDVYDLIVVGGGIAGASLAGRVAASGAKVLVLEREREFHDRVRGEWIAPWGVDELERLGALEALVDRADAHELRYQSTGVYQLAPKPRDLLHSRSARPALTFFHPKAQEALLWWAKKQGAEVQRGARVTSVVSGRLPSVTWGAQSEGGACARLVAGADGRASLVRQAFDRTEQRRGEDRLWAGVRMSSLDWPDDTGILTMDPSTGYAGAVFPQGDGTARLYLGPSRDERKRLSGSKDLDAFLAGLRPLLGDRDVFANAEALGPLATFDTEIRWIDTPYEDGVALVGDAAGYTDPTWGQGLSMALRDARELAERLVGNEDWLEAAAGYAAEHDRYFNAMAEAETWLEELLLTPGPEGDAKRARAFNAWATDHTRNVDAAYSGPDHFVADEKTRQRFFGLDVAVPERV